jgi:hypothetical protein
VSRRVWVVKRDDVDGDGRVYLTQFFGWHWGQGQSNASRYTKKRAAELAHMKRFWGDKTARPVKLVPKEVEDGE